tara:strand:+ start:454 stop:585 length:132 start_codon:yes stop_codon:yes gene_type:complete
LNPLYEPKINSEYTSEKLLVLDIIEREMIYVIEGTTADVIEEL